MQKSIDELFMVAPRLPKKFIYYTCMSAQKNSIYIETTIPSFATAKTSRDAIIAGHQAATILFWENERQKYELYVSHNQTVDLHTPMLLTPEVLMEIEGGL